MRKIKIEVIPLREASERQKELAAEVLIEAFRHMPPPWVDMESARAEVDNLLSRNRLGFIAVEGEQVLGLIGAIKDPETYKHAWELHPLAVAPFYQHRGVGTLLVRTLEEEGRRQGISTIWLGTDDDFGGTNLFGVDLYPNVLEHLANIQPTTLGHPYIFYQKMGYTIVGVIPDAGGFGKPDILMAKRIGGPKTAVA